MKKNILFLFFFVCYTILQAQSTREAHDYFVIENVSDNEQSLTGYIEFLYDSLNTLTIDDVTSPRYVYAFNKLEDIDSNIVINNHTTFWLRISLDNQTQETNWMVKYPSLFKNELYYSPDDTLFYSSISGFHYPPSARSFPYNFWYDHATPVFLIKGKQVIYIRAKRTFSEVTFDFYNKAKLEQFLSLFSLKPAKVISQKYIQKFVFDCIIFGILGAMLIYNFVLYFFIKDKSYLYYSSAIAAFICYLFYSYSYYNSLFFNFSIDYFQINIDNIIQSACADLIIFFFISFTQHFLQTSTNYPKWHKLFQYLKWYIIIIHAVLYIRAVTSFLSPILHNSNYGIAILIFIVFSILLATKKETIHRYYVYANIPFFCFAIIYIVFITLVPLEQTIEYLILDNSLKIGFTLQMVSFSIALAARINIMREKITKSQIENERLEKEKVLEVQKIIEEKNVELEQKVIARTAELAESNEELNQTNEELEQTLEVINIQKNQLEDKNRHITDSIQYAQKIQQAILPPFAYMSQYLEDYFVLFKPRDIVSGDFYYFEAVDEDKLIVAAIDCTGHGVPGAFMTMIGTEILNESIQSKKIHEPDMILNKLHKQIRNALRQKETKNRDGMDMALLSIDKKQKQVDYAGAKNSLIYIQNNTLYQIKADKMSIGGEQKEKERIFTKHTIDASQPTIFYLFSDGYQDQFGGERKKKFMIANLKKILLEIHHLPASEQQVILDQKIMEWMKTGNEKQIDDILVMGIRV
ncbi:MAG: SpoIIE family protein phosphatase [Bernardetiaceae bacterium]|nr:SpoIIE family protein phosphatase [Bernardetiaceae bacterium]